MENYEQKYKKALSWAHSAIEAGADGMFKEDLEHVFPELKESEDERIRKEIISFITDRKNWFPKEKTKASWVAWLEKQGEQILANSEKISKEELNPSWSEEDERIYNEIIDFFLGDVETRCTTIDKQRHFGYWLKSLKPQNHWKPSEEQMEALKYVVDYFGELTEHFVEYEEIKSLYNDLKSL